MTVHKKTALLLVGHGSTRAEVKAGMEALGALVRGAESDELVEVAFLSQGEPDIAGGIERCVARGARRILLCPCFLFAGRHVRYDLPAALAAAERRYPQVELFLAEPLGAHGKLAEVIRERAAAVLSGLDDRQTDL